jgi:soluble lytic murein transglycosylase
MPLLRSFLAVLLLSIFMCSASLAQTRISFTPKEQEHIRSALYFAQQQHWRDALYHTQNIDPAAHELISWLRYRTKDSGASFEEITHFIEDHENWPEMPILHQRAEEALTLSTPTQTILEWFADSPPTTADGLKFYAKARASQPSISAKDLAEITELLRQAWIKGNFGKNEEREFYNQHQDILRAADHQARIDQLLWQGKIPQARAMLGMVSASYRRLCEVRIQIMENRGNINTAVSSVPRELQNAPGLLYERLLWNARKGNDAKVRELLHLVPTSPPYPSRWWDIKNNHIRLLLKERQFKTAYAFASKHGSEKGEDFAEAEWLAGWTALRFLGDPKTAYKHFFALYQGTQYPVSKARGAYWAGRASEKNGNQDIAAKWYQNASIYKDTFYGQLAIMKLDRKRGLNLPPPPVPTAQDIQNYRQNELVKAAAMLLDNKQNDLAKKMLIRAVINAKTPGEISLITEFGQVAQNYNLSVETSKQASRKGMIITSTSYPVISQLYSTPPLEVPLSLAIIRQESGFDKNAQSQVGATGLMQLMPATASMLAKELHVRYDKNQLTNQAYNLKLGNYYLQKLINSFDGSYILAIASYNGGQGNVRKWIRDYGDPRRSNSLDDIIDWIEFIPFSETRNYTQRILENIQIYREILHKKPNVTPSVMLENDLKR